MPPSTTSGSASDGYRYVLTEQLKTATGAGKGLKHILHSAPGGSTFAKGSSCALNSRERYPMAGFSVTPSRIKIVSIQ